jgi:hypothetical protein
MGNATWPRRFGAALAALVVAVPLLALGATASATQPQGVPAPPYVVRDPAFFWRAGVDPATGLSTNCFVQGAPFTPQPYATSSGSAMSRVLFGLVNGASYHIEYPSVGWNGELVLYAHGYNGNKLYLCAGQPNISRDWYLSHGYAWAASSYSTNGYDVRTGVADTHRLIGLFTSLVSKPSKVWMTGDSMGGHITAVAVETYPNAFAGAMPTCGVLGDVDLFNYFFGASAAAAALAGHAAIPFPVSADDWVRAVGQFLPNLGSNFSRFPLPPTYTAAGQAWRGVLANLSGGFRPGIFAATNFWNGFGFGDPPLSGLPFLLGLNPATTGGTAGIARGNVVDTTDAVYQVGPAPDPPVDEPLNEMVTRVAADKNLGGGRFSIPTVKGDPRIPVLSLHGLGDLFVPFSMEQDYARRTAANGAGDLFVSRAIREVNHCSFSQAEYTKAFTDLTAWARGGPKPAGDDILNPAAVSGPFFGCTFTDGPHPLFADPAPGLPCPTGP